MNYDLHIHYPDTLPFRPESRVLALGLFDGMHLGHMEIMAKTIKLAKAAGLTPMVQTFTGLNKTNDGLLYTFRERCDLIASCGIKDVFVLSFDDVRDMAPELFFDDMLRIRAGAAAVVAGDDYTFGKGGAGNPEMLKRLGKESDIGVRIVPELDLDGRRISTTRMRECLAEGNVSEVARLCGGRPYYYSGRVIKGKQEGRKMGFPTANLPVDKFCVKRGVYASRITIGPNTFYGVTNIGRRPTIENDAPTDIVETNIFDFDEDIYGVMIKVELIEFIRPEKSFSGRDELIQNVEQNKTEALKFFRDSGIDI